MRNDMSTLKSSFETLHYEHLGLSQRLELTKQLAEDSASSLSVTVQGLSRQQIDARKNHEELHCLIQEKSEVIKGLDQIQKAQGIRLEATEKNVKALHLTVGDIKMSLGMMEDTLNSTGDKLANEDEEVAKIRSGVGTVVERLDRLDGVVQTAEASHVALEERVENIGAMVDSNAGVLSDNVSLSRSLTEKHVSFSDQLEAAIGRIDEQAINHVTLVDRVDLADAQIRDLDARHQGTVNKVEAHWQELEKTSVRLNETNNNLAGTNADLSHLGTDLGAVKEVVAKIVPRLDLAHEYLHGVGKGIQEANQFIAEGRDGMIRPKKKPLTTVLPGLPCALQTGGLADRPATR
jgi:chromosome segregation ATPase